MRCVRECVLLACIASCARGQRSAQGVWWGSSPGAPTDERLQIQVAGDSLLIFAAPLGRSAVRWGPVALAADGTIEFHRPGDPPELCTLKPTPDGGYDGTCRGATNRAMTLARQGNPGGFEVPIDGQDSHIAARAKQLLSGPAVWNRQDTRECDTSSASRSWSLGCALYQAAMEVVGTYQPGRPVVQEVRVAVGEVSHRPFNRAVVDFNNAESTSYADVAKVFDLAEQRLRAMKACVEARDTDAPVAFPSGATSANAGKYPWWENIGHTVDGHTYLLRNYLGPMDIAGEVPDEWVKESKSIQRRTLPVPWRNGVDAKGTIADGHQWRYVSLCGESFDYHDVPAEAAAYFDRLIDAAYFQGIKSPS
jgi:hypothetical protein